MPGKKALAAAVDHTLLRQDATEEQIRALCDEAVRHQFASVCVPPAYVATAREYVGDIMRICTVVGFPNGYSTTAVKAFETGDAVQNGADEIDMVLNIGWVKDNREEDILNEILAVKAAAQGRVLKVIIETCLLRDEEKIRLCGIITKAGADFIKTSTGFGGAGATEKDVALLAAHVGPGVRVKAAGGIATLADAERFLELGAQRLGSSRLAGLLEKE